MRIRLATNERKEIFSALRRQIKSWDLVAARYNISSRTLQDWRNGSITLPSREYLKMLSDSKLPASRFHPRQLSDFWHIEEAARLGGRTRVEKHGNPGTPEGRSRGGYISLEVNRKNDSAFNNLKNIILPSKSEALAELMGIFFGDGHLSEYQASVTTSSVTDIDHAHFTARLIKELFGIKPTIAKKSASNALTIVASSRNMVLFLNKHGMPIGNKIANNISTPQWIIRNGNYQRSFLRGLFDTDGSVYLDRHRINGRQYSNIGWTITSHAANLRNDIVDILRQQGFSPTCKTSQKSVFLRVRDEVQRYFEEISTDNPKHAARYRQFSEIWKGAPNG